MIKIVHTECVGKTMLINNNEYLDIVETIKLEIKAHNIKPPSA